MVAQARRLLHSPSPGSAEPGRRGLLLIVDTLAVDVKAKTWAEQTQLREWVKAIEGLGFKRLRHQALKRSHGLVFVTVPLPPADLEARLEEEALPELLLRREAFARAREVDGPPP